MNETLRQTGTDGRAVGTIARVLEVAEPARWAAVDFSDALALKALVREHGGMGEGVHTFYALHDEAQGCAAREHARFETVRNQNRLMLEAERAPAGNEVDVRRCEAWSPALGELFETSPPGEWARAVRDEAWFAERLGQDECLVALRGDTLLGFAAARECELAGERALWAWDWHTRDEAGAAALTSALAERASSGQRIGWVLPDVAPDWLVLQRLGARIEPTQWFLDVRTFSRQTTDRWLQQHWMYTPADFPGLA